MKTQNKFMDSVFPKPKPKLGLALSGGSALGNVHIGVLQALSDNNIKIDFISGTSAGAVVAACFAFGLPLEQMAERAKNLSWLTLSKFSFSGMGLVSPKAIGDIIEKLLGKVSIEQAKIPLAIVATDIQTGQHVVFRKGDLAQAVMASAAIPGMFTPVEINSRLLVDGGVSENLPLLPLEEMGSEVELGVNLARFRSYKKPGNALGVMLNTFDIMTHRQANSAAARADVLIEPHLEAYTASDFKKATELINIGYRAAAASMPKIKEALSVPKTERLKKPKPGFWQKLWDLFKN